MFAETLRWFQLRRCLGYYTNSLTASRQDCDWKNDHGLPVEWFRGGLIISLLRKLVSFSEFIRKTILNSIGMDNRRPQRCVASGHSSVFFIKYVPNWYVILYGKSNVNFSFEFVKSDNAWLNTFAKLYLQQIWLFSHKLFIHLAVQSIEMQTTKFEVQTYDCKYSFVNTLPPLSANAYFF